MQRPLSQNLEVATPERVALSLPVAGIGFRTMAYLLDAGLFFLFWVVLYFVLTLLVSDVGAAIGDLPGWATTLVVLGVFASQWLYWTVCEVFFEGQSMGKRVVGIRVIRADGSPVGVFESAVRNLCRAVDFLPALYAAGVASMLLDRHHRRLGDLAAGTLLVRSERIALDKYLEPPTSREGDADHTRAGPLSAPELELVLSFLERAPLLDANARRSIAEGLVRRFSTHAAPEELAAALSSTEGMERWLRQRATGREPA